MEPAGGVQHQHVDRLQLGRLQRARRDLGRLLAGDDRQRGDRNLFAQHPQLFLRGGAVDVERGHHDLLALRLLQQFAELGGAGGLARALQADHHDHHRRRGIEIKAHCLGPAQHLDQRVVDDLDDLLTRRDRLQHLLADRLLGHRIDEAADHRQRDIGLEQRDPHFAHRLADIVLAQRAAPTQRREDGAEPVGQTVEHCPGHSIPTAKTAKRKNGRRTKPRRPAAARAITRKKPADETSSASLNSRAIALSHSNGGA